MSLTDTQKVGIVVVLLLFIGVFGLPLLIQAGKEPWEYENGDVEGFATQSDMKSFYSSTVKNGVIYIIQDVRKAKDEATRHAIQTCSIGLAQSSGFGMIETRNAALEGDKCIYVATDTSSSGELSLQDCWDQATGDKVSLIWVRAGTPATSFEDNLGIIQLDSTYNQTCEFKAS